MDDRAVKGIPWTMLSYAANRVVSVGTTIILARLLVPEDFGLFALAMLGTGFISQFSGMGLGTTLVLRQDLDRRGQGTILTLLLITGVAFAFLLAALTPLLGWTAEQLDAAPERELDAVGDLLRAAGRWCFKIFRILMIRDFVTIPIGTFKKIVGGKS